MKKLLIILILLFSINIYSQHNENSNPSENHVDFETDSGKVAQSVLITSFTYFTIQQFTFNSKDEWLKIPLSMLASFTYEMLLNSKTTDRKQLIVLTSSIGVNFTFEIFKSKKRSLIKKYKNE